MRLIDIDVEEVSLVDQPAIVEKFLVVKRLEQGPTDEQVAELTNELKALKEIAGK